jgi:signal peptidase I
VVVADRSMEPTLQEGEVLWVRPRSPDSPPPRRRSLVVLRDPQRANRWLIKRVFALAGERVLVGPTAIRRRPARLPPLRRAPRGAGRFLEEVTVPERHIFVVSDRLDGGRDSRKFGPVALAAVVGVARANFRPRVLPHSAAPPGGSA